MSQVTVQSILSMTANAPPTIKDSAGTEVGTFCRAWVNFNGTGVVAIRAAFNVTSITDNGVGDYTINFINAMPDSNYSFFASSTDSDTTNVWNNIAASSSSAGYVSANLLRIVTAVSGAQGDTVIATVAIFR